MSVRQMAARLGVTSQAVYKTEEAEADGSITINRLRKAADALNCDLVYALVPRGGTLEEAVARQAEYAARTIVHNTERTMRLEAQERDSQAVSAEIQERAQRMAQESAPRLWEEGAN